MNARHAAVEEKDRAASADTASRGRSRVTGCTARRPERIVRIEPFRVSLLSPEDLTCLLSSPQEAAVAVCLASYGDVEGHLVLLLTVPKAQMLVDMLRDHPPGTTDSLGAMEQSLLGGAGCIAARFLCRAMAEVAQLSVHLSPPAVMVGAGATGLGLSLVNQGMSTRNTLVVNALFADGLRQVEAVLLAMSDAPSLTTLQDALERRWRSV